MCGICGFTGTLPKQKEILQRMMDVIIHRGPDGSGMYLDEQIAMGFRRLSIIDLENGNQPMCDITKQIIITFNGEIYNHSELRQELQEKGYVFQNRSDTEVLLYAYVEYGEEMLQHLRGMFAFLIWDKRSQTVFGARDFFGIKPLYYALVGKTLVYGSEIKSMLEYPGLQKKVNPVALENYLTFQYSVLPETFFKEIFHLPPAHCFTFYEGKLSVRRYWMPSFAIDFEKPLDLFVDEIDDAIHHSVQAHKISDVEVGAFLSSGVDSSYLAAIFHGNKTFTVGFDYRKYNETHFAKALAKKIGVENESRCITKEEYWNHLKMIQYHMDEPLADPSAIALYFVSQLASKHVKVALSGEGADELFGGYNIYLEPAALAPVTSLPRQLRMMLGALASAIPFHIKGKNYLIRGSKDLPQRFIGNAFLFSERERSAILRNPTGKYPHEALTAPFYAQASDLDEVTQMQFIDIMLWMMGDILLKADKMSMANSLEVRVPLLDKEVFRIARTLPPQYKTTRGKTKYAFRQAARRYLPDLTAEKKKLGFPVPIRIWLREEPFYSKVRAAFLGAVAQTYFQPKALLRLLDEHRDGKTDNSRKIWAIYIFLIWHSAFFGG